MVRHLANHAPAAGRASLGRTQQTQSERSGNTHPRQAVAERKQAAAFTAPGGPRCTASDVSVVFSGRIVEHAVGQGLYAASSSPLHSLNFWAREKTQSNAELDCVLPVNGKLIPVEVKSGASGRLRSQHAFVDASPHSTAVRLYGTNQTYIFPQGDAAICYDARPRNQI